MIFVLVEGALVDGSPVERSLVKGDFVEKILVVGILDV